MAKFKLIISNPKENTVQIVELEGPAAQPLISREIGELVDGNILGLSGKKLKITGGTDKDGIPMRKDVSGGGKKRILLSGGIGFKPQKKGERKRKLVRGRVIIEDTYEINMVLAHQEKVTSKIEKK
jgi:small subunit ribosomal protein S6e